MPFVPVNCDMVISGPGLFYPSTYNYLETPKKLTAVQTTEEWEKIASPIKNWGVTDALPHYHVSGGSGFKALNTNNSQILSAPGAEQQGGAVYRSAYAHPIKNLIMAVIS